jgi:ATP-dependent DNA helicase RecG
LLGSPTPFNLPDLASSLSALPGVGPATAKALAAKGLRTWGDALFFLPIRYEDRRRPVPVADLKPGELAVVRGKVLSSGLWGRKGKVWRLMLADDTGRLTCLWFRFKKPHLESFAKGDEVFVVGEPGEAKGGGCQMAHPEVYRAAEVKPDHKGVGLVAPVYSALEGVRPGSVRKFMAALIERTAGRIPDPLDGMLPPSLYAMNAGAALSRAHQPPLETETKDLDPLTAPWRKALAFNELFFFELGLALKRRQREARPARALEGSGELLQRFLDSLPFKLTPGQKQALAEIRADLAKPNPMGRLLMGDVGTGKTVVAAAAAVLATEAGVQAALMAPTEVLARQHQATLSRLLEPLGLKVALATGSQNGAAREASREAMAGAADLVVGTHALISNGAQFRDLGLVIIDEQHRFGVHQRLKLAAKGAEPHLLVLSATPIPRTLALALAGHLEISDLPERPGARPPVATRLVAYEKRRSAVEAMAQTLKRGEQVYVICPLVEASEVLEAQDVITTQRNLAAYFPDYEVGLLHGRMSADEQEAALRAFKTGQSRVLCATTVVEVGVDVPGATLMVVLAAERFGLSQLHQLRGRVGRGDKPGQCLLVAGPEPGEFGLERLKALAATADGRQVAEADLMLRGPGEALGARQSGLPPFKVARWSLDAELVPPIREAIAGILAADPGLSQPRLQALKDEAVRRWGRRLGLLEAG